MRETLLALMGGVPGARWQTDDQLHVTLSFVGEVDRPQADDIASALAALDGPRPTIALQGAGSFDHKGHVHSIWVGIALDAGLRQLRDRINRALLTAGARPEQRAFKPHVTLARLGREAGPIAPFLAGITEVASAPVTLDAFLLFESRLGHHGASYEAVARYPLR
jgi:2'-5' RNA ligase